MSYKDLRDALALHGYQFDLEPQYDGRPNVLLLQNTGDSNVRLELRVIGSELEPTGLPEDNVNNLFSEAKNVFKTCLAKPSIECISNSPGSGEITVDADDRFEVTISGNVYSNLTYTQMINTILSNGLLVEERLIETISCIGATPSARVLEDGDGTSYSSVTDIIINGTIYPKDDPAVSQLVTISMDRNRPNSDFGYTYYREFTNKTDTELKIELVGYATPSYLGDTYEMNPNPTVAYDLGKVTLCLAPKYIVSCEPSVLPMLTQVIPQSDQLYYSYRINGGDVITETTSAGNGYLAQQVFVNTIAYQWRHPLSNLFSNSKSTASAFLATYTDPIQGASVNDSNVVTTITNTVEFLLTPEVEYDLIKIIFGEDITLNSCAIRSWN